MSMYMLPSSYYSPLLEDDLISSLLSMGRGMREMDRSFGEMFRDLTSLSPCTRERGDVGFSDARLDNPIVTDKDGNRRLNMRFDVRQFKPEEIKVKSYDDGRFEVSAKHETKDDHHQLYREYRRVCSLPQGVKLDTVKSHLHPGGILVVEAPLPAIGARKPQAQARNEPFPIAIQHIGSVQPYVPSNPIRLEAKRRAWTAPQPQRQTSNEPPIAVGWRDTIPIPIQHQSQPEAQDHAAGDA